MVRSDQLFSLDNPVLSNFAFYGTVVLLKMMALAFLTSWTRFKNAAFANREDALKFGPKKDGRAVLDNPDVERVRRNHLNDLENIIPFMLIGLFYVLTNPSPFVAVWHFRVFVASRFLHTLVYQTAFPQPARAICFVTGVGVCVSMAVQILAKAHC